MARISAKLTYANVISTIALFVALGGGAYAAATFVRPGGVVDLCVSHSGAVKVLAAKKSKCGKGTSLVAVNQQGRQGPAGAQGPAGTSTGTGSPYSAGPGLTLAGTAFSADLTKVQARIAGSGCTTGQALQSVAQDGTPTCTGLHGYSGLAASDQSVASQSLPPGTWALFGQMTAGLANTAMTVYCTIDVNGSAVAHATQDVPATKNGSLALLATTTTTAANGTSIDVSCNTAGTGFPLWSNGTIVALPLAALN